MVKDCVRSVLTIVFDVKLPFVRSFEFTLFRLLFILLHIYPTNSENMAGIESKIQNPCERTDKNVILWAGGFLHFVAALSRTHILSCFIVFPWIGVP